MTTTVTLKTHSWPVDVTTQDYFDRSSNTSVETVDPHSERQFHISNPRQITFTELPLPATNDPTS